jgi:hypothetical protein
MPNRLTPKIDPLVWRQIVAEQAIQRVVNEYGRGVDGKDFERVRACFYADALVTYGGQGPMSRDEAVDWLARVTAAAPGLSHYFGVPSVDLSPDGLQATCETWCINANQFPRGKNGEEKQTVSGLFYEDTFECRDGKWLIALRKNSAEWNIEVDGNTLLPVPPGSRT